eukprot:TRINITY_DN4364_c1_g1_i1.p1 TRINITY_DN4364_c1_g1~~TRINITY_DN4364_c1_g1_i1.p1  ORF type:complete len:317 (+),score=132.34 TRINITY_DN4364_c1_g1_i1:57-1007(+)
MAMSGSPHMVQALSGMSDLCWLERHVSSLHNTPVLEHCLHKSAPGNVADAAAQFAMTLALMVVLGGVLYVVRYLKELWRKRQARLVSVEPKRCLVPEREREFDLTVVLDLDETLISFGDAAFNSKGAAGVRFRPHLKEFLEYLKSEEERIEVIVWTAATRGYSKCVVEAMDTLCSGVAHHRVYRTSKWYSNDNHVKDLHLLNRPMGRTILVENRAASGRAQPDNMVLVPDFTHKGPGKRLCDPADPSLLHVKHVLQNLLAKQSATVPDVLKKAKLVKGIAANKIDEGPARMNFHYVCGKFDSWQEWAVSANANDEA